MSLRHDRDIAPARDALAAHLSQNPDFARARGIEQDYGGLQNALTVGRTALRGGSTAVHPDDYAAAFSALTVFGQAAQWAGLADSVYRKLGDTRNDLTAINDVVKGPNDRSRSIIGTTFGQAAADRLAGSAQREAAFAKTYGDVLHGSMTARRLAMQKAQADAEVEPYQTAAVRRETEGAEADPFDDALVAALAGVADALKTEAVALVKLEARYGRLARWAR